MPPLLSSIHGIIPRVHTVPAAVCCSVYCHYKAIPANLRIVLCLKFVSNVLDLGHFCLKMLLASPKCISIIIWVRFSQKMRDLVIFVRDGYQFCLKSSRKQMVGRYIRPYQLNF